MMKRGQPQFQKGPAGVERGQYLTEKEIDQHISTLHKVGHDSSGWNTLYRDPVTNDFWEVMYPHGEMHGGGPRMLRPILIADARAKYPGLLKSEAR